MPAAARRRLRGPSAYNHSASCGFPGCRLASRRPGASDMGPPAAAEASFEFARFHDHCVNCVATCLIMFRIVLLFLSFVTCFRPAAQARASCCQHFRPAAQAQASCLQHYFTHKSRCSQAHAKLSLHAAESILHIRLLASPCKFKIACC